MRCLHSLCVAYMVCFVAYIAWCCLHGLGVACMACAFPTWLVRCLHRLVLLTSRGVAYIAWCCLHGVCVAYIACYMSAPMSAILRSFCLTCNIIQMNLIASTRIDLAFLSTVTKDEEMRYIRHHRKCILLYILLRLSTKMFTSSSL